MSGTVDLTDDLCWIASYWLYNDVLERVAARIWDRDGEFAQIVLDGRTFINGGFLDLRVHTVERVAIFADAARSVLADTVAAGSEALQLPEYSLIKPPNFPKYYSGYVTTLTELCDMLTQMEAYRHKK